MRPTSDSAGTASKTQSMLAALRNEQLQQLQPTTWRPVLFHLSKKDDRDALCRLLAENAGSIQLCDTLIGQLRDLIRTRHPTRKLSATELDSLTKEHLGGVAADEYGAWAYYPWSRRLVHVLDKSEFAELRTNRNRYKITAD